MTLKMDYIAICFIFGIVYHALETSSNEAQCSLGNYDLLSVVFEIVGDPSIIEIIRREEYSCNTSPFQTFPRLFKAKHENVELQESQV